MGWVGFTIYKILEVKNLGWSADLSLTPSKPGYQTIDFFLLG
jgi:hypothetical protein